MGPKESDFDHFSGIFNYRVASYCKYGLVYTMVAPNFSSVNADRYFDCYDIILLGVRQFARKKRSKRRRFDTDGSLVGILWQVCSRWRNFVYSHWWNLKIYRRMAVESQSICEIWTKKDGFISNESVFFYALKALKCTIYSGALISKWHINA